MKKHHNYELKHTLPTQRYGQYLTHAHNHITPAVAAMESCFVLDAGVIWLCTCVRYWLYRGVGSLCFSSQFWSKMKGPSNCTHCGGNFLRRIHTVWSHTLGYLSNRRHFLWVYRRDNPRRMLGAHKESLFNHEPKASDLQPFLVPRVLLLL